MLVAASFENLSRLEASIKLATLEEAQTFVAVVHRQETSTIQAQ